ncbi:homoserine acetyltransferase family protein [Rutstroemia sp. NJR-2017a WRK4]|nr:homoserine acetyltransferase family protein [Rutstroemia sp. NJR-2017a WRK4]
MPEVQIYKLGNWKLQSGQEIPDAFIAYKTFGDPKLPAIINPSWYSGGLEANEWLIGEDKVLSPKKYFIITTALFGNGQSSSPSNTNLSPFPKVTFYDNVRAQHTLITKHLNITHARAVLGWSMGAGQTYQWATSYPDFMDICVPFCGSAKTSEHNQVFLEGVKAALVGPTGGRSLGSCGDAVSGGKEAGVRSWGKEERETGLKAFARVYAGWGFSQAFYREKLYQTHLGFKSLEDFMQNFWEAWALSKDPENLLTMLYTWQAGDCSQQEPYNGDFKAAMQAIKAKTLVLPCKTDLYFPPEDSEIEVANMKDGIGKCEAFPSIWGHWAGGPGDSKEDVKWLEQKLREVGL